MERCSLHPFDESSVPAYVAGIAGETAVGVGETWPAAAILEGRRALELARAGGERGTFGFTFAFARALAGREPSFAHDGLCLTAWEARVDRGVGMLLRPPARLFIDAGLEPRLARALPTRIDLHRGTMGGAYVPARLMAELERQLEARLERSVRRLIESEADGVAAMGLMLEVARYASERGLALFEAIDVVGLDADAPGIAGARVLLADKRRWDKPTRQRLEQAAKPPQKPSVLRRLMGRKPDPSNTPFSTGGGEP